MASDSRHSPSQSDSKLFESLLSIPVSIGITPDQYHFSIKPASGGPEESVAGKALDTNRFIETIRRSTNSIIRQFKVQWPIVPGGNASITVDRRPEGDLTVAIAYPDQVSGQAAYALLAACNTAFPAWRTQEIAKKVLGAATTEHFQQRELALNRLEELLDRSIEKTNQLKVELTQDALTTRREYQAAVDQETDRLRSDLVAREQLIEKAQQQLDLDRKALDDSSATHARREARKQISSNVTAALTKFTVTADTSSKRRPIAWTFHALMAMTGVSFLYGILQAISMAAAGTAIGWYVLLKVPVALIGFGVSASWYIRWENAWFQQHATEEFRLRRYDLDVHRATWLMELLFEWQEKKEHPIPPALVERLSHGLFDAGEPPKKAPPNDDALAAFLRHATNVKLPLPNGGELNITGSNFRKVEKDTEGSQA